MNRIERSDVEFKYVLDQPVDILVVDDDPIQREFASVYLSTPVATVETAPCAMDGLEMLASRKFDVALVDIDMPGISGFEMVRRLRANPAFHDLPIIVVTGREDIMSIDEAYDAGATSFVTKPVNWRLLSHQIRFVLRTHRALRAPLAEQTARAA
ncbi:response regulator [Terrarubrum flagellatum]|uniref:response regulator n=1 Tax=Terrirubrum flagellatum TaxID=2895980 RepID=UPI003144E8CD